MVDKQWWWDPAWRIGRVLLETWDPIGVQDEPNCQEEYNRYIGGVYRFLMQGASDTVILEHLRCIETEQMGLPGDDDERLHRTVVALRSLNITGGSAG